MRRVADLVVHQLSGETKEFDKILLKLVILEIVCSPDMFVGRSKWTGGFRNEIVFTSEIEVADETVWREKRLYGMHPGPDQLYLVLRGALLLAFV